MREGNVERKTKETTVHVIVNLEGSGDCTIETGIPFFDHMLMAMGKHGGLSLTIRAKGESKGDSHHLIEDVGIVLGSALKKAYGNGMGIHRFAHAIVPMDDACARVAVDFGGRGYLVFQGDFGSSLVGEIPRELFEHFFYSLCINAGLTAHIAFDGSNDHHKCEAIFKSFGIAIGESLSLDPKNKGIPSTKGIL